jgi:hypothetical protein
VNREAVHVKHCAKYLAERVRVIKPARPETIAKLEKAYERAKDHALHRR